MKKIIINGAILVSVLFICSFTGSSEYNVSHTCDASNDNKCTIRYVDGTTIQGAGNLIKL